MFKSKENTSILIKTNDEYNFFDLCDENSFSIEVTYMVNEKIEKTKGYVTGYFPELDMFSVKSSEGNDFVIPIKNVELIKISGKL